MITAEKAEQVIEACKDERKRMMPDYLEAQGEYKRLSDLTKVVESLCFKECPAKTATEKANIYRAMPAYQDHIANLHEARLAYDSHQYKLKSIESEIDIMRSILSLRKTEASIL